MIVTAITKTAEGKGVYIPYNMESEVCVSFHINNFDKQVEKFDRKNKVQYLLIVCFQRRMGEFKPIELNLEKKTSLKLKEKSFEDTAPCDEPSIHQFRRTEGWKNVSLFSSFIKSCSTTLSMWQVFSFLEQLLVKDIFFRWYDIKFPADMHKGEL